MKNPVVKGWYADPESRVYDGTLYMYVTKSLPFDEQTNLDAVVSNDLEHFCIVSDILDMSTFVGARRAIWAPSVIKKDGLFYIVFAANTIHNDGEVGGLYIGVSDGPRGKFRNIYEDGRPFLNVFYNGAQPIDAHFFEENGEIYLYWGGWGHLNVGKMSGDMKSLVPLCINGEETLAHEITPEGYVEAPYVFRNGKGYILMYSSGGWVDGSYCVKTAVSQSPTGPFAYRSDVLKASELADGPGHNSGFTFGGKTYIAYHRRYIGDTNPHHRVLCIDRMYADKNGVKPIIMT